MLDINKKVTPVIVFSFVRQETRGSETDFVNTSIITQPRQPRFTNETCLNNAEFDYSNTFLNTL